MALIPVLPKLVGQRVKRREDPRLIRGLGTYVDDVKIAGMHHLAFKRSDIAHGRILSVDTRAAEAFEIEEHFVKSSWQHEESLSIGPAKVIDAPCALRNVVSDTNHSVPHIT